MNSTGMNLDNHYTLMGGHMFIRPFIVSMMFLTLLFQNCGGDVGFTTDQSASSNLGQGNEQISNLPESNNDDVVDIETPVEIITSENDNSDPGTSPLTPTPTPTPTPNNNPPLNVNINTQLDNPVNFSQCTSFVEVNKEDLIELPNRATSSTCYYVKLINRIENHPSGTQGEVRAADVLASNHNGNSTNYISPFILGDAQVQAKNLKNWKLALSGSPNNPNAQMRIDNFYLVQILFGDNPKFELVSAFGTADAEPIAGQKPILLDDKPIELKTYAPSGTATVEALNITPPSDLAASYMGIYNLRLRALDCGGSANGLDVYLVFH